MLSTSDKALANKLTTARILLLSVTLGMLSACGGGSEPGNNTSPSDIDTSPGNAPFYGTFTLDDYDWFLSPDYRGVIEIDLAALKKTRIFDGSQARHHESGVTTFRQGCGDEVYRIMAARPGTLPVALTPCSSTVVSPSASATEFQFSTLSPDGSKVAVEARYYGNWEDRYSLLVYDTSTLQQISRFEGIYEPAWLGDGRLITAGTSGGLYVVDSNMTTVEPFANGVITGAARNPAPHQDGTRLAFELDQQIWQINMDGTNAEVLAVGDRRYHYPTWSPDGSVIAYLATVSGHFDRAIYFTDLRSGEKYVRDLDSLFTKFGSDAARGPMTWWIP